MKVLICGDRHWKTRVEIEDRILQLLAHSSALGQPLSIIEGMASGADRIAGDIAIIYGIALATYEPDWDKFGTKAGPIRNREMLDEKPDLVVAFHNDIGKSKGTWDTIKEANRRGIKVEIISSKEAK